VTAQGFGGFVFLNHNSLDKQAVEALAYALLDAGVQPWLDKWDLVPGRPWQVAITDAIRDAHAVAVCIGEHGLGHVQGPEVEVALDRAWRDASRTVVPVLLPGAAERPEVPDFLKLRTWVDLRQGLTDATVQRLVAAIHGRKAGPPPTGDVPCPYPGLPAFEEADAPRFFGREDDVAALLARLAKGERLLTLVGASGSGKSSLMRAGLIPAIRTGQVDGRYDWLIVLVRPGPRPIHALAVQLIGLERGGTAQLDELKDLVRRTPSTLSDRIDLWLARAGAEDRHGQTARVLLAVDQFEEVFTQSDDPEERRALIDNLLHAATMGGGRITVVITLRADFLGRALDHSRVLAEALKRSQVLILPMAPTQLRAAIQRPALQARARFDDGLVDTLVDAVANQPGDLPLLQFALRELWRRRGEGTRLTWTAYQQINGVRGAIAERAQAFLSDLADQERDDLRRLFGRLVQVGEGPVDTRRRDTRKELESLGPHSIGPLLDRLIEARLLTAGEDGIQVAHEALIRHWDQLRSWVDSDREFLLWRERFGGLRDAGALLSSALLVEAERWLGERRDELTAAEREYIDQGVALRERDRCAEAERLRAEQERRERDIRKRSVRKTLAVVVTLFVLSVLSTLGVSAARRESIRGALASDLGWVRISAPPGGQFMMGCVADDKECFPHERAPHEDKTRGPATNLPRPFEIMSHEVTVGRFQRFIDAQSTVIGRVLLPQGVSMRGQPNSSLDSHPVVSVSWDDARNFCAFVRGRIPTEAEWEYAARGGNAAAIYPWGNAYSPDQANGAGVAGKDQWWVTAPVGSFPPNGYGLFDMIGNAWEWTSSVYRAYPYRSDDGREDPTSRKDRVVRGGSFYTGGIPQFLRVSNRYFYSPDNRLMDLGFRCVRDAST
jgi:formylglycine-generating enzyme required for sulfatase activity